MWMIHMLCIWINPCILLGVSDPLITVLGALRGTFVSPQGFV